jgi:phage-related protein
MAEFDFEADYPATKSVEAKTRDAKFGDGYSQRVSFGINQVQESWNLRFDNRDLETIEDIEEFLIEHRGVDSFDWTPPNELTAKKYICKTWSVTDNKPLLKSLSATFEQVFEP